MHIVAIAWIYIALMMAVVEAFGDHGTVLGAVFTFALYGLLPVGIVLYLMNGWHKAQNRQRRAAPAGPASVLDPDAGSETPGLREPTAAARPTVREPAPRA